MVSEEVYTYMCCERSEVEGIWKSLTVPDWNPQANTGREGCQITTRHTSPGAVKSNNYILLPNSVCNDIH